MYTTTDRTLTCADCSGEFIFTASEQDFFAERQFSEPRRCPSCRAARKLSRGSSGDPARSGGYAGGGYASGGAREMFEATCSSCGRVARVPFQPTGSKPVYCSDCFTSQRQSYR
jgi:CxxC-x17-CxxC domain-containing protein